MALFENFVDLLKEKTGWKTGKLNKENHYVFTLLGRNSTEVALELFSPEGITLIMQTKLLSLSNDEKERVDVLKDYATKEVGACKKRASVLTVDNNSLILYRKEKMQDLENLTQVVNDFLKDIDWWQQKTYFSSGSPFSFSMSWGK